MAADDTAAGDRSLSPPDEGGADTGEALIGATLEGLRRAAEEVEHAATVAETLQRSLLPDRLPELPGLSFAARYLAGSGDSQVGGDWYDAIELRDGRAAIAIGDVVGHGLSAAARMARLQNALRAYALEGLRPGLVLERMNTFAREISGGRMTTLLFGIVDPDRGQLQLASAGHPPPLVITPEGPASFAEGRPASPLGVVPFPAYEESVVPLHAGSTVLLFTDGLVERSGSPLEEGLEWLRGYAGGLGDDPDELCGALLEGRFRDSSPLDDVAVLAVRLDPVPASGLELKLAAETASLVHMRRAVGRWLRTQGADAAETYECLVACGEACANAIAHAYGPSDASYIVEVRIIEDVAEFRVRDFGTWRPPRGDSGGRGMALIEELMDELVVDRGAGGTALRMRRHLKAAAS